jgi:hypothetical protein
VNAHKLGNAALAAVGIAWSMTTVAEAPALPTWSEITQPLVPIGDLAADKLVDPKDPLARQDLYRFLHEMMSQAYFALQYQDPRYPDFWPMFNQVYAYGFANPDDSYYQAVVEDSGVYRISGYRGTTRVADFEVGSGEFAPYGRGALAPTLKHYDLDHDVKIRKRDGWFEVVLSAERPKDWKDGWWKLDPKATFIWVRQISYDWKNEVDGRFAIERLDVPAAKPRDSAERIAEGLRELPKWTANWADWRQQWIKRLYDKGLINKVVAFDLSKTGGITNQSYLQGLFDLQPDEALILETEVPKPCRYWAFQLTDEQTNTLDWMNRQSSLNGFTAKLDKDGRFRAVISARDPGVPNWLDVVDHQRGMIVGRWKECSSYPEPTVTKVKVADVRRYLPADTATISAQQRDAQIRAQREAVQLRRRW